MVVAETSSNLVRLMEIVYDTNNQWWLEDSEPPPLVLRTCREKTSPDMFEATCLLALYHLLLVQVAYKGKVEMSRIDNVIQEVMSWCTVFDCNGAAQLFEESEPKQLLEESYSVSKSIPLFEESEPKQLLEESYPVSRSIPLLEQESSIIDSTDSENKNALQRVDTLLGPKKELYSESDLCKESNSCRESDSYDLSQESHNLLLEEEATQWRRLYNIVRENSKNPKNTRTTLASKGMHCAQTCSAQVHSTQTEENTFPVLQYVYYNRTQGTEKLTCLCVTFFVIGAFFMYLLML